MIGRDGWPVGLRPGPDVALYDIAFLAWGAVFVIVGWTVIRSAMNERTGVRPSPPGASMSRGG